MYFKIILIVLVALLTANCHSHSDSQDQDNLTNEPHLNEDAKVLFIAYNDRFELFTESDPLVVGELASLLSHITILPEFKPLENSKVTLTIQVQDSEVRQTIENPSRKGIYNFTIVPEKQGSGTLKYEITNDSGTFEILVPEIQVYDQLHKAYEAADSLQISETNTVVFTKEQSWKTNFSTGFPTEESFGKTIKTTAQVQSLKTEEQIVSSKTYGMVTFPNNNILKGKIVSKGQVLSIISGSELADNNFSVRYAEAQNSFEKARADYLRAENLAEDKIISEKELLNAKVQYENAKNIFENLSEHFNESGQNVSSPINGYIKDVFAENGAFVEPGQPLFSISQNQSLELSADVQRKFAPLLEFIQSANIHTLHDNQFYTLEELNGKILTYGKSTNPDNYLIPVHLQIENNGNFVPGGFVEVFLKTTDYQMTLTIPNTAILEDQGYYYVYVQVTPELFEKREISIGKTDGIKTEILSGLSPNERIITIGAIFVHLSQATQPIDAHSGHVH